MLSRSSTVQYSQDSTHSQDSNHSQKSSIMDQIRWGLIGCGSVSRSRVARAILDDPRSQLVAACRRNETELASFCESFDIERAYTNVDELVADVEVDAVYIATPVCEHLPQTLAAAQAGKHVLVEKPMGMSVIECDRMIAACQQAKVKLGVAYYRRFYPIVHRIKELLRNGELGTVMAVSVATATTPATLPGQEGYWRLIPGEGGGGALMDIGSHRINILLHLFGEVADITAVCDRRAADYAVEDTAVLLLRFQSGLAGTLQCHFGCSTDPDEFAVLGTRARLVARPLNGDQLIIESDGERRSERHPPPDNLCGPLVADFVAAILEHRAPTVSGEEGRATNLVIERAYHAATA